MMLHSSAVILEGSDSAEEEEDGEDRVGRGEDIGSSTLGSAGTSIKRQLRP